jgi:hypothetical protein
MSLKDAQLVFAWLHHATEEQVKWLIARMTSADFLLLDAWFELWAHEAQLQPKGEGWRVWLMMAGRGFGKTRAGAEWIHRLARGKPDVRIALVGATIADARSVMVEGVSGLLNVARVYGHRVAWEPSLGRLRWPNGSEAQLFSGDNADGLRGPEFDFAWGVADARYSRRRRHRGRSAPVTASFAGDWRGLYRGRCSDGGMDRKATICGRLHQRGMALRLADRRHGRVCEGERLLGELPARRLGNRRCPWIEPDHRW